MTAPAAPADPAAPRPDDRREPFFALPPDRAAKAGTGLVADDERHLARIAAGLAEARARLEVRLRDTRRETGGHGQAAMERDHQVHRLLAQRRTLDRYDVDLCLGRTVAVDGSVTYVGRAGLHDRDGEQLLVDWRSPAAEPFFAATHAAPRGLASRRRYSWSLGRVVDFWDEVFDPDELRRRAGDPALDDQSSFVASLGAARSPQMRDVLGTIASDQDAVVRAGSRGALVVDGGPGTGKTVVALHRTAYLLHADPRLGHRRGGVLFVGPHRPYLAYVADVLPSLGEEGVRTTTLRDLVPEGASAVDETDLEVARLKAGLVLVDAVEPAVALHEEPPTTPLLLETAWADVRVTAADWAEAFAAPDPGTPHNEARDEVEEALLDRLVGKVLDAGTDDDPATVAALRRALAADERLVDALGGAWPRLEAADLVGDLLTVPAYLRHCAPSLTEAEVQRLRRRDPCAWTTSDLPLLDAARARLGDPGAGRRRRRHEAAVASERARVNEVVEHLVEHDESEMQVMSMLRRPDGQHDLVDVAALTGEDAGPEVRADEVFAHVVVDEAQELTDAEWRMVLRRCPSRSLTVVGDRAQARRGFPEPWAERLARVGLPDVTVATLTVGYRTPAEVMEAAGPVVRAAVPDANVPVSVRRTGVPVGHGAVADLPAVLRGWLAEPDGGVACVVGTADRLERARPAVDRTGGTAERVRLLTPDLVKGLEFDLVVLLDPASLGHGVTGAVDRYVAMTRATQRLVTLA